jgi:hypothetical protein
MMDYFKKHFCIHNNLQKKQPKIFHWIEYNDDGDARCAWKSTNNPSYSGNGKYISNISSVEAAVEYGNMVYYNNN